MRTMVRLPLAALLAAPLWGATPAALEQTVVFRAGEDGYNTYRIPALIVTKKVTLLAFCEGRRYSRSDTGDIDLVVKRSSDQGRSWSRAIRIADFGADTVGNPAPVLDRRTGAIWLLLTSNHGQDTEKQIRTRTGKDTRRVWVSSSRDDGRSWAPPREITASVKPAAWTWYATGPGNGIQLASGRLMIPCDHDDSDGLRYSHVIYSDDGGQNWKLGGSAGPMCNGSAVVELSDGALLLNMRSYHGKNRRAVAVSRDGGLSWSEPVLDETLVEPVCQASLIRFGRRRRSVLLFSNPAATRRVNMTVRLSRDQGKSWPVARTIHAGPSAYSNLAELKGGLVGLLYEKGEQDPYETITFARFPLSWLER